MQRYERRFPCVDDMQRHAEKKIPAFGWDYLVGGVGREENLRRNRSDLDQVLLLPRYGEAAGDHPKITASLFGRSYAAPFGVAPMGLNGLIWPGSERSIAAAARAEAIPYVLSTYATQDLVEIKQIAGEFGWFQLYPISDPKIEEGLIERVAAAGYETMVVTVDIPGAMRRDRDIRNGLSVPPKLTMRTFLQALAHPHWLLRLGRYGIPRFRTLEAYGPKNASIKRMNEYLGLLRAGHVTQERFQRLRQRWPGKLVVKGLLDPNEAVAFVGSGADGIILSNHGGRQLDAAPSTVAQLSRFRARLGRSTPLFVDGGVRNGLDIARMLALGADFVFVGRAFMFAATIGDDGPEHLAQTLKKEFLGTLEQLGCGDIAALPDFLYR